MQVNETLNEGLKREYQINVPAGELTTRVADRLDEIKSRVRINGFRPGKVPVSHLKRMYGRSVLGEVLEQLLSEANRKIIDERKVRFAMQPKVNLPESVEEIENLFAGKADLSYTVSVEILPDVEIGDLKKIKAERLVADVSDKAIDEALERIANQNRPYKARKKGSAAKDGDRVTIDYKGTVGGEAFEGGSGEGIVVELGSNTFIPGFEEQLVGVKVGDEKTVKASFPDNYLRQDLAGREGVFEVSVKEIEAPEDVAVDDELAKAIGFETIAEVRTAVQEQIERDQTTMSRQHLKRAILDALDEMHRFDLPQSLVDQEFQSIWNQVERDRAGGRLSAEDAAKSEDDLTAEYRKIAERRVRLGLLLAELGEKNNIKVTDDEVTRGVVDRARQFPGREQQVWEYYRKNPDALAEIRAPIFEEKIIDYIVELAKVTEKKVSRDELLKEVEEA